jgi:hypothetical protein
MDVFLEHANEWTASSILDRVTVAMPLQSNSMEDLITEVRLLKDRGIRHVGVRRQQVFRIGQSILCEVLDDAGIAINSLGFAGGFTGALGISFWDATDDVRRAADLAATLGARFLVVVPGGQGLHTYNHAERTVRMGFSDVLYYADQRNVRLLVPTDTVLGCLRDVFQARGCTLNWVEQMGTTTIRPLIVIRGNSSAFRLPRGWRESLAAGGCLRICDRCSHYEQNLQLLTGVLSFLGRRCEVAPPGLRCFVG